ncbi:MAG: DUF2996 domain-containing protein [Pegethrix bostrychoides GSE-TBD4-15B]|jgi:hypothetical protein|uniref:DUF2996 domain-containing protein n=1 Tax=Pegethrix bostrychoides GSE-TBD4-15B TaxID=2839662 RepID=A0A951U4Q4_9CYAN|nr:DUF2996 domain-containing protein [Pegethrix bostrychoides GSE-TBD4-15B]
MPDETTLNADSAPDSPAAKPAKAPKPTAEAGEKKVAKKEKPPALEDKPFTEFISQDFLPNLKSVLAKAGLPNTELQFEKRRLPIAALGTDECWQVMGQIQGGRQFTIIFSKEDIQAAKFYTCADSGAQPTTIESFMIDERKVSLDLLLMYTVQRLNGQKWLVMN